MVGIQYRGFGRKVLLQPEREIAEAVVDNTPARLFRTCQKIASVAPEEAVVVVDNTPAKLFRACQKLASAAPEELLVVVVDNIPEAVVQEIQKSAPDGKAQSLGRVLHHQRYEDPEAEGADNIPEQVSAGTALGPDHRFGIPAYAAAVRVPAVRILV